MERRPVRPEDVPFLVDVYGSTRERELAQLPWTPEEKRGFIESQFQAQDAYYREQFPHCEFSVLLLSGTPVGRIYVDRREDEIRIVDIALLPQCRNRGIGSALMQETLMEANAKRLPVRIHVERDNPAMRLYLRLGFVKLGETGVYDLMERPPTT